MGFYKEEIKDYFLLDTPVENMFINEYMIAAPGDYVKIYLFTLMYAGLDGGLTSADVARHLNMEPEDVLKAWAYWEKQGVIRRHRRGNESGFDYDVEFVSLKAQLYGQTVPAQPVSQTIGSMMEDAQIKKMIGEIERITGRVFNSSEIQKILAWSDDYQMPPEIITYAFSYSKKQKKTGLKYPAALIRDWSSHGLREVTEVEEYLAGAERRNAMHRRVFQALGFPRNATEEEARIMDTWFDEMKLPLETVLDACSRTSGISNPNINYVNKVLQTWKQEGKTGRSDASGAGTPTGREIMEYYDLLRQKEEAEAEARRRQVYAAVPQIRKIEDQINALNKEFSRIIISDTVDKKKAGARIRQEMDGLNAERAFLLTENNFMPDYMEIKYNCPHCKDTGMLETGEQCQCYKAVTREMIEEIKKP